MQVDDIQHISKRGMRTIQDVLAEVSRDPACGQVSKQWLASMGPKPLSHAELKQVWSALTQHIESMLLGVRGVHITVSGHHFCTFGIRTGRNGYGEVLHDPYLRLDPRFCDKYGLTLTTVAEPGTNVVQLTTSTISHTLGISRDRVRQGLKDIIRCIGEGLNNGQCICIDWGVARHILQHNRMHYEFTPAFLEQMRSFDHRRNLREKRHKFSHSASGLSPQRMYVDDWHIEGRPRESPSVSRTSTPERSRAQRPTTRTRRSSSATVPQRRSPSVTSQPVSHTKVFCPAAKAGQTFAEIESPPRRAPSPMLRQTARSKLRNPLKSRAKKTKDEKQCNKVRVEEPPPGGPPLDVVVPEMVASDKEDDGKTVVYPAGSLFPNSPRCSVRIEDASLTPRRTVPQAVQRHVDPTPVSPPTSPTALPNASPGLKEIDPNTLHTRHTSCSMLSPLLRDTEAEERLKREKALEVFNYNRTKALKKKKEKEEQANSHNKEVLEGHMWGGKAGDAKKRSSEKKRQYPDKLNKETLLSSDPPTQGRRHSIHYF